MPTSTWEPKCSGSCGILQGPILYLSVSVVHTWVRSWHSGIAFYSSKSKDIMPPLRSCVLRRGVQFSKFKENWRRDYTRCLQQNRRYTFAICLKMFNFVSICNKANVMFILNSLICIQKMDRKFLWAETLKQEQNLNISKLGSTTLQYKEFEISIELSVFWYSIFNSIKFRLYFHLSFFECSCTSSKYGSFSDFCKKYNFIVLPIAIILCVWIFLKFKKCIKGKPLEHCLFLEAAHGSGFTE